MLQIDSNQPYISQVLNNHMCLLATLLDIAVTDLY